MAALDRRGLSRLAGWRAKPLLPEERHLEALGGDARHGAIFGQGFVVALTNPKSLFFFAAFFPQFLDVGAPAGPQLALLCPTFILVAALFDSSYAILAGRARGWLRDRRRSFGAEARDFGLPTPRGLLLLGVQGCGKSLTAKVVAREWRLPLLKLDAGSLFDKYLGESEKNLRKAISQAEGMAPAVLWIDEIEKGLAPSGGSGDGDGGVSRRMFGTFLTWLQEKRADVFVVATANDLQALPPELLRKGRFDEIFFVDLPDPSEREGILRIHLRLRKQDPDDFDLAALVAASEGFSGAEIEQATIAGLYRALHDRKPLTTELLLAEMRETVPLSVSRREDVARLRALARERFVPVS